MRPTIENVVKSEDKVMTVRCKNGHTLTGYIYIMADDLDEVYVENREMLSIVLMDQIESIEEAEQ